LQFERLHSNITEWSVTTSFASWFQHLGFNNYTFHFFALLSDEPGAFNTIVCISWQIRDLLDETSHEWLLEGLIQSMIDNFVQGIDENVTAILGSILKTRFPSSLLIKQNRLQGL